MYNKKSGLVNRAFSVVLALLMVLSILPITAFASTSVNVDSFTVCVKDSVNNADIMTQVLNTRCSLTKMLRKTIR